MKMKNSIFSLTLIIIVLAAGCGNQSNANTNLQETQDFMNAVETGIIETIEAAIKETSLAIQEENPAIPQSSDVSESDSPGPTLPPTQPVPVFTATPSPLPPPCYRAELVDETIPDGTVIRIGDGFTKTWMVKNTGVCAWNKDFTWKLVDGNDFRGETELKLTNGEILPGEVVSISIEMGSPLIPGRYRTIYKIFTDEGAEVTPNGFWIDVEVIEK